MANSNNIINRPTPAAPPLREGPAPVKPERSIFERMGTQSQGLPAPLPGMGAPAPSPPGRSDPYRNAGAGKA